MSLKDAKYGRIVVMIERFKGMVQYTIYLWKLRKNLNLKQILLGQ